MKDPSPNKKRTLPQFLEQQALSATIIRLRPPQTTSTKKSAQFHAPLPPPPPLPPSPPPPPLAKAEQERARRQRERRAERAAAE